MGFIANDLPYERKEMGTCDSWRQIHREEDGHVKTETQTGVTLPGDKERLEPPGAGRKGSPLEPPEGVCPSQHLAFGHLASRTVKEYMSVVLSCIVYGLAYLPRLRIQLSLVILICSPEPGTHFCFSSTGHESLFLFCQGALLTLICSL